MKRWGVRAKCGKCQTQTFYLHARVAEVFYDQRGTCPNCGSPFRLEEQGKAPPQQQEEPKAIAAQSTQVDSGPTPGSQYTAKDRERCTLTPEEEQAAARLLGIALPEGVDL